MKPFLGCLVIFGGMIGGFLALSTRSPAQYLSCTATQASCSAVTRCCYNAGGFQTSTPTVAPALPDAKLTIGGSATCGVSFTGPFGFCVRPSTTACGTPQYDPDCT